MIRSDNLFASAKPPIAGMLREAERQLKSSLMDQDMMVTYLELVKVHTSRSISTLQQSCTLYRGRFSRNAKALHGMGRGVRNRGLRGK